MTPKEKAHELVSKYLWPQRRFSELARTDVAKECALIAVREIINEPAYADSGSTYWQQVKQEISNL